MSKLDSREEAQGHVPNGGLAGHSVGDIYPFALQYLPAHEYWTVLDTRTGRTLLLSACLYAEQAVKVALEAKRQEERDRAFHAGIAASLKKILEQPVKPAPAEHLNIPQAEVSAKPAPVVLLDLHVTEAGPFEFYVSHAAPPALSLRSKLGPFKSKQEAVIAAHGVLLRNLMHS